MGKISKALEKSLKEEKKDKKHRDSSSTDGGEPEKAEPANGTANASENAPLDLTAIHSLLDEPSAPPQASPEKTARSQAPDPNTKPEASPPETPSTERKTREKKTETPPPVKDDRQSSAGTKDRPKKEPTASQSGLRPPEKEDQVPPTPSAEQEDSAPVNSPTEQQNPQQPVHGAAISKKPKKEVTTTASDSEKPPALSASENARKKIIRLRKEAESGKENAFKRPEAKIEHPAVTKTVGPGDSPFRSTEFENIDHSLVTLLRPRSFEAEQFKLLRTNILFPVSGNSPRSILITSALPGEGKTFLASNLAASFALNPDRRVLLIDADIRKPEIHERFGIEGKHGLSDFLTKGTPLPSLLRRTNLANLTVLPGGRPPYNPSELLSSEKMPVLLKEVTTRYSDRYVILDSPPPKLTSETSVLARLVDGIILVVRARETKRELVEELIELLGKDKILGVVMNAYDVRPSRYYGYSGYGKYGKYYSK